MTGDLHLAVACVGAATALLTLPGAIELLLLTSGRIRRTDVHGGPRGQAFRLATIIPAHNEGALVGRCVASVLASAQNGAYSTVVVVADNCTDTTLDRALEAGARVLVRQDPQRRGKGYALRFAFDQLMDEGFDGFLIVDADSVVSPNLVAEISGHLLSGADAVQARYRVDGANDSLRKRLLDVALLAFNVLRPRGRDGWGLSAGISGNGFGLSRKTLLEVPYTAKSIVEDLEYHLLLVSAGRRVRFADLATVYGSMPGDSGGLSAQRARWEGGRLRVAIDWIPKLMVQIRRGRFSAVEPLLDLLTFPLAYQVLAALLLCALPVELFRWYGGIVLAIIVSHVISAIDLGEQRLTGIMALTAAPFYIVWKLTIMCATLRSSRRDSEWIRTQRETGSI